MKGELAYSWELVDIPLKHHTHILYTFLNVSVREEAAVFRNAVCFKLILQYLVKKIYVYREENENPSTS
jgi:GH18 family chitinase